MMTTGSFTNNSCATQLAGVSAVRARKVDHRSRSPRRRFFRHTHSMQNGAAMDTIFVGPVPPFCSVESYYVRNSSLPWRGTPLAPYNDFDFVFLRRVEWPILAGLGFGFARVGFSFSYYFLVLVHSTTCAAAFRDPLSSFQSLLTAHCPHALASPHFSIPLSNQLTHANSL